MSANTRLRQLLDVLRRRVELDLIEYSCRGSAARSRRRTLGLYAPPSCSRSVSLSLIWNSSDQRAHLEPRLPERTDTRR